MPSPINVTLRGYLDFFGLKNGGMNPQMPRGDLAPVMELQRWYLESRVVEYTIAPASLVANTDANYLAITATTPSNISNGVNLTVPQNEMWLLLPGTRLSAFFDVVANQGIEVTLVTRAPNNATVAFLPMMSRQGNGVSTAGIVRTLNVTLQDVYFVAPGMIISGYQFGASVPTNSIAFGGCLRLVRLRI